MEKTFGQAASNLLSLSYNCCLCNFLDNFFEKNMKKIILKNVPDSVEINMEILWKQGTIIYIESLRILSPAVAWQVGL
jgi:hypothetical protein